MKNKIIRLVCGALALAALLLLIPLRASACVAVEFCPDGTYVYAYCTNGGCVTNCQCRSGGGCASYTYYDSFSNEPVGGAICCTPTQ